MEVESALEATFSLPAEVAAFLMELSGVDSVRRMDMALRIDPSQPVTDEVSVLVLSSIVFRLLRTVVVVRWMTRAEAVAARRKTFLRQTILKVLVLFEL